MLPPPENRPTANELQGQAADQPMRIAGKPAAVCPYCGCAMFAYRTTTLQTRIIRYERCRNSKCGRKFVTRQQHAEIVREVDGCDKDSSTGSDVLQVYPWSA